MYLPFNCLLLLAVPLATVAAQSLSSFDSWQHGRVALEDVSIHFRYAGSGPPLLLVHGNPQHSLTWYRVGPILAQNYTVIAPDNRGAGDSSIPSNNDYSALTTSEDLKSVLEFLNITSAYVFGHDKGAGFATALAAEHPNMVKMLGVAEYVLPGFGYDESSNPAPFWDLYQNWQLAFFRITDAAEFFISGKVKEFLQWYFFHGSYSGAASMTEDIINQYTSSISKPGFLRAMLGPFSTATVNEDRKFFNKTVQDGGLTMPVLGMGGEASFGTPELVRQVWSTVKSDLMVKIVPKAGHWIADENPTAVARIVSDFFGTDNSTLEDVDMSSLDNRVTLQVAYFGTLGNARLGGFI